MTETEEKIIELLKRIDALDAKLDLLLDHAGLGTDQELTRHEIDLVKRYISNSGNVTWKAINQDNDIIYLRQSHKKMLQGAGLWSQLNAMDDGEDCTANIVLYTVPDGDFHRPVDIEGGGAVYKSTPKTTSTTIPAAASRAINHLRDMMALPFVVLDTETTDMKGEVVSIAVIDRNGDTLFNKVVKPRTPISDQAAAIHGITNDAVANCPIFPEIADELRTILDGKSVIGWNIKFDRESLERSANAYRTDHNMPRFLSSLESSAWLDVMTPFSVLYGVWSGYHDNYRYQKLTTAAAHYGISTNGAHNALADCQTTLKVAKMMIAEVTS